MLGWVYKQDFGKEELCTFPLKYVENPDAYNELTSHISVYLDPRDMTLKGGRPRTIDIPVGLMADLWQYVVHERNVLDNLTSAKKNSLFLTRYGTRYNGRSLNSMWSRLNLPFKVTPHTLRHTYATHTLYALGNKEELRINPLMYLRDRLGHSSIITTQRYLHFIHQLTDEVMTEYQDEIDGMSCHLMPEESQKTGQMIPIVFGKRSARDPVGKERIPPEKTIVRLYETQTILIGLENTILPSFIIEVVIKLCLRCSELSRHY